MPSDLTAAEWNVVETLDAAIFASKMTVVTEDAREEIARAVVAAVRDIIVAENFEEAGDVLDMFAALKARGPTTEADIRGRTLASGIEAAAELVRKRAAVLRAGGTRPTGAAPMAERQYLLKQVDEMGDEIRDLRTKLELAERLAPLAREIAAEAEPIIYRQAARSLRALGHGQAATLLERTAQDMEADRHGV